MLFYAKIMKGCASHIFSDRRFPVNLLKKTSYPRSSIKPLKSCRPNVCVILLIDPETNQLKPRCTKQRGGGGEIVLSQSILNEVIRENAAVLSADARADSRFDNAQSVILEGIRSAMCVPLLHG